MAFLLGGIEVNVTGGTAPYSFAWSNGSSQQNLLNAFAGNYALTVTDLNGCQLEVFYTIEEPVAIGLDFEVVSTTCFGDSDGRHPGDCQWRPGALFLCVEQWQYQPGPVRPDGAGTYNVTVTDANNCSVTQAVVVGDSRDLSVGGE